MPSRQQSFSRILRVGSFNSLYISHSCHDSVMYTDSCSPFYLLMHQPIDSYNNTPPSCVCVCVLTSSIIIS
jgi:hypothetical protein